jgi:uncharacterized RDD family membrane protein YckC
MQNSLEAIRERMSLLNDEILIRIVTEDASDYESDALQVAKQELKLRAINIENIENTKNFKYLISCSDISINDLIPFNDIIRDVNYSLVEEALFNIYPQQEELGEEYKNFYKKLLLLSVTKSRNVLINVDKQLLDIEDLPIETWDVSGVDTESGDKLDVDLFNWNHWLAFFVNKKDLQIVCKETYIAHCLYKMTTNGFNEEDIKSNLEISAEESSFNKVLFNTFKSNPLEVINDNVLRKASEIKSKIDSIEVPQVRPWVRYWARRLDSAIILLIVLILIRFFIPLEWNMQVLGVSIIPLIQAIIETILLSTWGTTPGKWILRVKIRTEDGNKLSFRQSLYRSSMVLIIGEGALLNNVLNTFTCLVSSLRLTNMGKTYWDEKGEFSVTHERIGILRCILVVLLVFIITLLERNLYL